MTAGQAVDAVSLGLLLGGVLGVLAILVDLFWGGA